MEFKLKPNKETYCSFSLIYGGLWSLFFLLMAFFVWRCMITPNIFIIGGFAVFLMLIQVYRMIALPVCFEKEEYQFSEDRLLAKGGGLFSSHEKELLLKNVTNITLKLPYLHQKFYNTGVIMVQSAGGGDVEVTMTAIDSPKEVYQRLIELLRKNGFSLKRDKVIEEDKPSKTGIIFESLIITVVLIAFIGGMSAGFITGLVEEGVISVLRPEFFLFCACLLGLIAWIIILQFGTGFSRRYYLYEDSVSSKEDFFSASESTIPMENLSDSTLRQGLIGRLIGLHNLGISCQGGGQEIPLNYLTRGKEWKSSLDSLIKSTAPIISEEQESGEPGKIVKKTPKANRDEEFTLSFTMDKKRVYAPVTIYFFLAVAFIVAGIAMMVIGSESDIMAGIAITGFVVGGVFVLFAFLALISAYINFKSNKYHIKARSFEKQFKFISAKDTEFSAEKVTGIIIKEGIFDRMMKSCSVNFWSIGSLESLSFKNIAKDPQLISNILSKVGIREGEESHAIPSQPTMDKIIKGNIWFYPLIILPLPIFLVDPMVGAIATGFMVFIMSCSYLFSSIYYKFYHLELCHDYLCFAKGLLHKTYYYIRYDDIKYIQSTLYPMSQDGNITFEISGEQIVQQGDQQVVQSNRFTTKYITGIEHTRLALDLLFAGEINCKEIKELEYNAPKYQQKTIAKSAPDLKQGIVARFSGIVILALVVLVGITAVFMSEPNLNDKMNTFLPIIAGVILACAGMILWLIVWSLKVISYEIDTQKVIKRWGIFYKKQMAIHFADIDYIGKKQNFFNNMFKTANITVNTIGSSKTDLTLNNLKNFDEFYNTLKQNYQKKN